MIATTNTEKLIAKHEGFRASAYKDSLGLWSIGFGRLIDKRRNGRITVDEGLYLLRNDIDRASFAARRYSWFRRLSEVRKAVVIDMIFNLGPGGFRQFKKTIKLLREGKYTLASKEMLNSQWAMQVGNRAKRLSKMLREDQWEDV